MSPRVQKLLHSDNCEDIMLGLELVIALYDLEAFTSIKSDLLNRLEDNAHECWKAGNVSHYHTIVHHIIPAIKLIDMNQVYSQIGHNMLLLLPTNIRKLFESGNPDDCKIAIELSKEQLKDTQIDSILYYLNLSSHIKQHPGDKQVPYTNPYYRIWMDFH